MIMNVDRIKYVLTNWETLNWSLDYYKNFLDELAKFDLSSLEYDTQEKAKTVLDVYKKNNGVVIIPKSQQKETIHPLLKSYIIFITVGLIIIGMIAVVFNTDLLGAALVVLLIIFFAAFLAFKLLSNASNSIVNSIFDIFKRK